MQILLDVLVNFVLNGVHCLCCRNKYVIFYIKVTDVYNFFVSTKQLGIYVLAMLRC